MKCSGCGADTTGTFCGKCGTRCQPDTKTKLLKSVLRTPDETVVAVLGSNWVWRYLQKGNANFGGFSILTDKNVYFKGKNLAHKNGDNSGAAEDTVVALKNVVGSAIVHKEAAWAKIAFYIAGGLFLGAVLFFLLSLPLVFFITFLLHIFELFICVLLGIAALIFRSIYKHSVCTVFEITHVNDTIALDMNWFSELEARVFQEKLTALVEQHKEDSNSVSSETPHIGVQELREYKELLDQGILTQEEFEQKKKQFLGERE